MTTRDFLSSSWARNPAAIALCAATAAGYAARLRGKFSSRAWFLAAGLAVFLLAVSSPVSVLAEGSLFSAHMLQHLLLLLVAPPLLLLSLPASGKPGPSHRGVAGLAGRFLARPPAGWLAGVGAMWLWHTPALCGAAAAGGAARGVQIVSLLVMGSMFWRPIVGPRLDRRLSPAAGVAYLFSACAACTLLGIWTTFAPVGVCPAYLQPSDRLGLLPLVRDQWGLTPAVDQQIGGLLMWVPACLIYLGAIMGLLARWYRGPEEAGPDSAGASPVHPIPPLRPALARAERTNA